MTTKVYLASIKPLEDKELFDYYYHLLPRQRQEKIDSLSHSIDKRLSLGAGVLLLSALDREHIDITNLDFSTSHNNKPCLPSCNIFFNLSHSGDMAMCAISSEEVGCDIEKKREVNMNIAKRYFLDNEYNVILQSDNKINAFYRLWTLKESFMKATGLGFHLPLNSFEIYYDADTPKVRQKLSPKSYYFTEYFTSDDYAISVCSESNSFATPVLLNLSDKIL